MKIITTQLIVPCYVQKVSQYQWKSTDLTKLPLLYIIQCTVLD